jgi:hypothetical protein
MKTDADVFVFVDADVIPTPADFAALVQSEKLNSGNAVSGCYLAGTGRLAAVPAGPSSVSIGGEPRFVRLVVAGMGFSAVHRDTVERLERHSRMVRDPTGETWYPHFLPAVLNRVAEDGNDGRDGAEYLPEDYAFWWRVQAVAGAELWLDTHLAVGHVKESILVPSGVVEHTVG